MLKSFRNYKSTPKIRISLRNVQNGLNLLISNNSMDSGSTINLTGVVVPPLRWFMRASKNRQKVSVNCWGSFIWNDWGYVMDNVMAYRESGFFNDREMKVGTNQFGNVRLSRYHEPQKGSRSHRKPHLRYIKGEEKEIERSIHAAVVVLLFLFHGSKSLTYESASQLLMFSVNLANSA